VVREGKVVRTYSNKTRFPLITAVRDIVVLSKGHQVGVPSHVDTRPLDRKMERGPGGAEGQRVGPSSANDFPLISCGVNRSTAPNTTRAASERQRND
jgi:hypothetical protein